MYIGSESKLKDEWQLNVIKKRINQCPERQVKTSLSRRNPGCQSLRCRGILITLQRPDHRAGEGDCQEL